MKPVDKFDGRFIRLDDGNHRIIGKSIDAPAMILESECGVRSELQISDFHLHISLGNVSPGRTPDFVHRAKSEDQLQEQLFRKAVLREVSEALGHGATWPVARELSRDRLAQMPQFAEREKPFPAVRTIQLWRREFVEGGSDALVDKRYRSGNRTSRHDIIFEEIVLDYLEERYFVSDRLTIAAVVEDVGVLYRCACRRDGRPIGAHGRKVVESILAALPYDDIVKRRFGSKEARKRQRAASQFFSIEAPFDRVEIDSTEADIFLVADAAGGIARPWVTAAIDCTTGMILGLLIGFERPNQHNTIQVLREIMKPYSTAFFDSHGVSQRHQTMGRPLTIVSDQGSENKGPLIDKFLSLSGIEMQLGIPGEPTRRPFIERFFRTFSDYVTTLPGATQTRETGPRERTKRGMNEACYTLEQFVSLVQRWRFDDYSTRPRRRIQTALRTTESPLAAWKRLETDNFLPEPPSESELADVLFYETRVRKVHRYGIEIDSMQYWSVDLDYLSRSKNVTDVEVRIDPTDIRAVRIVNPFNHETFLAWNKEEGLPAISFKERREILAKNGVSADEQENRDLIREGMIKGQHHPLPKGRTPKQMTLAKARAEKRDAEIYERTVSRAEPKTFLAAPEDVEARLPVRLPSDWADRGRHPR